MNYQRIAFAKIGWSEFYEGDPVVGEHEYIKKNGDAHERYNFKKFAAKYYGYVPFFGKGESPPNPVLKRDWLIMFVARQNGNGKLTVVGWYENATFTGEYLSRPEYKLDEGFPLDVNQEEYLYTVYSDNAFLIPVLERNYHIDGTHIKRASLVYARGNNVKKDKWRIELAELAETLVNKYKKEQGDHLSQNGFPDQEHRKIIEEKSVRIVRKYFQGKGFQVIDRQQDRCGYDLLVKQKETGKEYFIEVKGTSGNLPHFYLTRKEMHYINMQEPRWKLVIVTDVLNHPKINQYSSKNVTKAFRFDPLSWEGIYKENV